MNKTTAKKKAVIDPTKKTMLEIRNMKRAHNRKMKEFEQSILLQNQERIDKIFAKYKDTNLIGDFRTMFKSYLASASVKDQPQEYTVRLFEIVNDFSDFLHNIKPTVKVPPLK